MKNNFGDELKLLTEEPIESSIEKIKKVFGQKDLFQSLLYINKEIERETNINRIKTLKDIRKSIQNSRRMLLDPNFVKQVTKVSQEHIDLCERYGCSDLWTKKPKLRLVK